MESTDEIIGKYRKLFEALSEEERLNVRKELLLKNEAYKSGFRDCARLFFDVGCISESQYERVIENIEQMD
jgi:hypothetical protein